MAVETTTQIIAFAESLIGETLDADLAINLANHAKDLIESDRPWLFLIKEDSSKTFGSGETYLTAKDLPTDFLEDYKVFLGDATLSSFQQYFAIPFYLRRKYNDTDSKYYIDHSNKKIHICGKVDKTYTIYLYYIYQTPELDLITENSFWPIKFRKLISYTMAEIYQLGIDADDIVARQAVEHNKQAKLLLDAMIQYDARLRLKTMNNMTGIADDFADNLRTDVVHR